MRVVMVSKALVAGAYQRKAAAIARLGVELTVLIPPAWRDRRGLQVAEVRPNDHYGLQIIPLRWNGNYHLHYYPTLSRELARLQPDLVHMDEEPYNLATWLGLRAALQLGATGTFFTWQNLQRLYPPPFRWFEQANYRYAPLAIAGNQAAATVLTAKGYHGEIRVIPQFGIEPRLFSPLTTPRSPTTLCRIGYAGGLLPEKGIDRLFRACAELRGDWRLIIAGEGEQADALRALATQLGIAAKIEWRGRIASEAMATFYHDLDLFVLPSRTRPNWKEQFGRVLIEAMACAVPVVGSDSGEIPNVIGAAGLIFPEEDVVALRGCLQQLLDQPALRQALGATGRTRALQHFTMAAIAEQTVSSYRRLLQLRGAAAPAESKG